MLYIIVIACEILFWAFLVGGLLVRYALGRPRAGGALIAGAAVTTAALLAAAAADLASGGEADASHVIAVVAVAYTIVYAREHLAKADRLVQRRLGRATTEPQRPPKAERERAGWMRHARMWAIGMLLFGAGLLLADEGDALAGAAGLWTVILAIDFVVSFSYSLTAVRDRLEKRLR